MSSYRLLVDADRSSLFTGLGPPRLVPSLQLHLFPSCPGPIPGTTRQQVLAVNSAGCTALVVPERPWKAVFFDMDSTVIAQESIVELARAAGKEEEVHRITELAMAGHLDFKSALRQRVGMLAGVSADVIEQVGRSLTINPGMHEFAREARSRGIELYLVSGGFNPLAERIVRALDFQGFRACDLGVADGRLTGELIGDIIDAEAKAQYIDEICQKRGYAPQDVVAVGDGANDLSMLQKAGAAIGYHPKGFSCLIFTAPIFMIIEYSSTPYFNDTTGMNEVRVQLRGEDKLPRLSVFDEVCMHLRFLNSTKQILPKKGAVFMIGSLKAFQNKLHEKILPAEVADLFREALKTPRLGRSPVSFTTLTGLAGPSKVIMGILPEKVAKDNSPTRREWIFQQLDAIESEENSLVVLYLDRPEHYGSAATAVARRLRIVNRRKNAKPRTIQVVAMDAKGQVIPADERIRSLSEQVAWACQVVDMPPNELSPDAFADEIKDKFKGITGCSYREIVGPRLRAEGLHGIHAVGKGADEPPRMIILDYKPRGAKKTIVLAGKGVTFDTGGLSLKPGASMVGMKGDMGGAAAILGAFHYLLNNKCQHRVIACVGLVENAIGPKAFRNDDVITMHSGKTVEVNNTDAEGRIVLADCLSYCARKYKPDLIIDAATLTGAQMVATGMLHAGVVSNREDLEILAKKVGKETGDMVVPLPFAPELYQNEFKSQIADMVNSVKNRSNAQPSCAAQFIYSHVDDLDIPWLHIDMAGPSNTTSGLGTGYGIQLISRLTLEYP